MSFFIELGISCCQVQRNISSMKSSHSSFSVLRFWDSEFRRRTRRLVCGQIADQLSKLQASRPGSSGICGRSNLCFQRHIAGPHVLAVKQYPNTTTSSKRLIMIMTNHSFPHTTTFRFKLWTCCSSAPWPLSPSSEPKWSAS